MSFTNKETVKFQLEAFRGAPGKTGPAGPAGADGKDYILTESDKQEIAGMIPGGSGGAEIDDTTPSTEKTYSSSKIDTLLDEQKGANETQDEAIAKKLNASELPTAINTALEQAKASGQFDGAPGAPGEPGEDGKTPEKGVDYWTAADKQEIVSGVLAALPTWTGGEY